MKKRFGLFVAVLLGSGLSACAASAASTQTVEISADTLQDKVRGGFLGQLLGDLNGLKHEMKYIAEPGNVQQYVPALPEGAWTDDDTDFEWVYIIGMQKHGLLIPNARISELWKAHINRRFWCANEYARQLMDLGITPPLTGKLAFNPWSGFNISGQFVSETFGLMAPGMPQTAARLGLHYTHVTIEGEPSQTAQLFTTMIATAYFTDDVNKILDAGMASLDPKSVIGQIIRDVRAWHKQYPNDWRTTRRLIKEKYTHYNGALRDRNGHELNTANVIASLLYGNGDYISTSIHAFNNGWDADNNAATACTMIGVQKGHRWMMAQRWDIADKYRNTSRDNMPENETIMSFADRIFALAERNIIENGGQKLSRDGKTVYRIRLQAPANLERLPDFAAERANLQSKLRKEIESGIARSADKQEQARAAYMAIGLDLAASLRAKYPDQWKNAIAALSGYPKVLQVLFFPSVPEGEKLRDKALAAGLRAPAKKEQVWK
jgi:ADP-ribosylglycohydrolase